MFNTKLSNKEQTQLLDNQEVNRRLDKIDGAVREIAKQYKSLQISLDSIYEDRDLITEVIRDVDKVRQLVVVSHNQNKNLSQHVEHVVEEKAEQIKVEVHEETAIAKETIIKKVVTGMDKNFLKVDAKLVKKNWLKRLLFFPKGSIIIL